MNDQNIRIEKFKNTMVSRYGVEYPQQSSDIRRKSELSYMKKFGVTNPMQNPEVAFRNSLKHRKINSHVDHEYNVAIWKMKLNAVDDSNHVFDMYLPSLGMGVDIIDGIDQHSDNHQRICPWFSLDAVYNWLGLTEHKSISEYSLYLLNPTVGREYLMNHSLDVLSNSKDHMFIGRVIHDDAIVDCISVTQDSDHNFYIDATSPTLYNIQKLSEYQNFIENYGIDLKYAKILSYCASSEKSEALIWYKGRERIYDSDRTVARNRLVDDGWNILRTSVYIVNFV